MPKLYRPPSIPKICYKIVNASDLLKEGWTGLDWVYRREHKFEKRHTMSKALTPAKHKTREDPG